MAKSRGCRRIPFPALAVLLVTSVFVLGSVLVEGIWLTLPASGTKCISEEIQIGVLVFADYYIVDDNHAHLRTSAISARVTSPFGNNLHHIENVTHGQFAFTSTEGGNYLACFWIGGQHQEAAGLTISLDWKIGVAAKDWDSVAKKDKIEGVELELRKLEGAVEAIRRNVIYLKNREAEMREVNEKTNTRVAWFSIMSLGVCILVSVLQVAYLQRFFQKRKLIYVASIPMQGIIMTENITHDAHFEVLLCHAEPKISRFVTYM